MRCQPIVEHTETVLQQAKRFQEGIAAAVSFCAGKEVSKEFTRIPKCLGAEAEAVALAVAEAGNALEFAQFIPLPLQDLCRFVPQSMTLSRPARLRWSRRQGAKSDKGQQIDHLQTEMP